MKEVKKKRIASHSLRLYYVYVTGRAQTLKLRNPCSQHWLDPTKAIKKQVKSEYGLLPDWTHFMQICAAFFLCSSRTTLHIQTESEILLVGALQFEGGAHKVTLLVPCVCLGWCLEFFIFYTHTISRRP